jgi:hypothetical protein
MSNPDPTRQPRQDQQFRDLRARNEYRAHIDQLRKRDDERSRRVKRILELNRHRIMHLSGERQPRTAS